MQRFVFFVSRWIVCIILGLSFCKTSAAGEMPLVTVPTPVFAPKSGTYTSSQTVTISDATTTATIYYTTNGTTPTTTSTKYSAPIKVSTTTTVKAIAAVTGETTSAVATATYTIETPTATPVFSPKPGVYAVAQKVTLSDTSSGAIIYYTTNGTTPTAKSTKYTTAIAVKATESLKAIAVASGHTTSAVASATYSIESLVATPVTSLPAGLYNAVQKATLTDATKGASIYYSLDGTTPTTASTKYTGAISIAASETLQAIAVAPGYIDSKVASAAYRIIIETVLHSFSGGINGSTDAAYPQPGFNLIQANDGNLYGASVYGGANASSTAAPGAIFKVTPAGVESIFYSFPFENCGPVDPACPYPTEPQGGVIQAKDGNLYGASLGGGTLGQGSIYKISLTASPAIVYAFGYEPDANAAQAQVIQGSDGNFYGTSYDAGAYGWGAAFRVTPDGAETVLHSFGDTNECSPPATDGCQPFGALVEGAEGAFYGTTADGGKYGHGTFYKVTTAGVETVLYSFGATSTDATDPPGSLIIGSDGNFYGVSRAGGSAGCDCGTVFKATPAGVVSVLYSFGGTNSNGDGQSPNGPLVEGSDGNFYGTTGGGGSASAGQLGIVFEVTPAGVETVLYTFQGSAGAGPDGGSGSSLILGKDGNFYGITNIGGVFGEGTIFKLTGVIPAKPLVHQR